MADTSDLHPEVLVALRTGRLPAGFAELATGSDETRDVSSDDEQRFRMLYRQMVKDRIDDWLDDNPYGLPPAERERIESYCRDYVQRLWAAHVESQSR